MTPLVFLAHAGDGHTWQAMVVLAGVALMGVVIAAAIGKLSIEKPDDLVMPLAIIAIGATLAPMASYWLSDAIGAGLPIGIVALVTVLLAALTPLDIRFPAPLPLGAITLAIVSTIILYQPLTIALHPQPDVLPLADDAEVTITTPTDGAEVAAGPVHVEVAITGGSVGPGEVPLDRLPDDPEEAGDLAIALHELDHDGSPVGTQQLIEVVYDQTCTVDAPCAEVTFTVDVEPGTYRMTAEFRRGDGTPFATPIRDVVAIAAE